MQNTLSRLNAGLFLRREANLLGEAFAGELLSVEPRVERLQPSAVVNLIFDGLVNREYIALLAEHDPDCGPNAFRQS